MKLRRIKYTELSAKQREIYNFQKVASQLADFGFNCIKLADDWQGADFLAYHKDGNDTLKVQLKSRVCVYEKYLGKQLYMAFPVDGTWYLIEHDQLLELVKENTSWLRTSSWTEKGGYSAARPNRALFDALQESRL
jgi:hypothetical protein